MFCISNVLSWVIRELIVRLFTFSMNLQKKTILCKFYRHSQIPISLTKQLILNLTLTAEFYHHHNNNNSETELEGELDLDYTSRPDSSSNGRPVSHDTLRRVSSILFICKSSQHQRYSLFQRLSWVCYLNFVYLYFFLLPKLLS